MGASDTRTTTDHDDIVGHGAGEEDLIHVSWDDWFPAFEDNRLSFLCQESKASGEGASFFRLVDRGTVDSD